MNIYEELENKFKIVYPDNPNATYVSILNYSDDLLKPFQRWFRYKEGYSIELVYKILEENNLSSGLVLDPFSGSGTTSLACNNRGIDSIGFEVNPFTFFLSSLKLNEFTAMEIYVAYKDYNWMMSFTEELLETICKTVNNGSTEVKNGENIISFKAPFRRLPILDAIKEKTGFDLSEKNEEEIRKIAIEDLKMEGIDESFGKGKLIDEIFGEFCEGTFIQPTFITDYPVEMSPLTKMHRSKPELTERFELMVNGKELANAYSELNDPIDQENRFKDQMALADKGDDEAMIIDQDFLRSLQYGMPPTSGIGIGIDRLCMLMIGKENIQEIILFPQMKPEAKMPQSSIKEWAEIGVAEDWVYVMRKAGFNLISDIKDEKAQGLQQKIGEINKKYKLGYEKPSVEDIQAWIDKANV